MNRYQKEIREILEPTVDTEDGKSCTVPTHAYYEWYMKEVYPTVLSEYTSSFRRIRLGEDEHDIVTLPKGTVLIDILPHGDLEVVAYGSAYSPKILNEEIEIGLKPESFEIFAGIKGGKVPNYNIGFLSVFYDIKKEELDVGLLELGFPEEHIFFLRKVLVYDRGVLIKEAVFTEVPFSIREDSFNDSITLFTANMEGRVKSLIRENHSYYRELMKHLYPQESISGNKIKEGELVERSWC